MRPVEIEAWARRVISSVITGQQREDSRVEIKSVWPEPRKAARRIAAGANAAHGDAVLWVIGVDEVNRTVTGVEQANLADWFNQVKAAFAGAVPRMADVAFDVDGRSLVALLFETGLAPFAIRVIPGDKFVSREIPWREATAVESATREQLLTLIAPGMRPATAEVVYCHVNVSRSTQTSSPKWHFFANFQARLFIEQEQNQQSVFASHRSAILLTLPPFSEVDMVDIWYGAKALELLNVVGPAFLELQASYRVVVDKQPTLPMHGMTLAMRFDIPNSAAPTTVVAAAVAPASVKDNTVSWVVSSKLASLSHSPSRAATHAGGANS